jgi:hypothetical protein
MPSDRLLVLANSRKHRGHCIAGLALKDDLLLRPVSPYRTGELFSGDCLPDGTFPDELDVVTFGHGGHDGDDTQPENVVIDGSPWRRGPCLARDEVLSRLRTVEHRAPCLFGNRGKAVPDHVAAEGVDASLLVIEPRKLTLAVTEERKARARFWHAGDHYDLPISELTIGPRLLQRPVGSYSFTELGLPEPDTIFLTLSLSLPLDGWHHKLVVGVIRL